MPKYFARKRDLWIFAIIVSVSLFIRIIGFNWGGNGTTFHADEGKVYKAAMVMARNGTFFSTSSIYPAQVSQKILFVIYTVYFKIMEARKVAYSEVVCIYMTRIVTAFFGTVTVGMSYFIAEGFKEKAGNICALLVGFCSPLVQQAHCSVMDTEVGCCFSITLFLAQLYFWTESAKKEYIFLLLMSLVCSISTMEKWYGSIGTLIIGLIVLVKSFDKEKKILFVLKQGIYAIFVYLLGLFVIAPNLFVFYKDTVDGLNHVMNDYDTAISTGKSLYSIVSWAVSYMGIFSFFFAVVGIVFLAKKRVKESWILIIGIIETLYMTLSGQGAHLRWMQPFFICCSILASVGIALSVEKKDSHKTVMSKVCCSMAVVSILTIFFNGVLGCTLYGANKSDTSNVCQAYLDEHNIKPENCIYDRYTCIRPAGYSLYYDSVDVRDSFEEIDGQKYVKKLGRDYALSKDYSLVGDNTNQVEIFEADYNVNKMTNTKYDGISWKWIDPYSICESIYYSVGLWSGKLSSGFDYYLSDISNIKGLQYISFENDDVVDNERTCNLSAIRKGGYILESQDDIEGLSLILRGENKKEIVEIDLKKNEEKFEIDRDYTNLELVLKGDTNIPYNVRIIEQ